MPSSGLKHKLGVAVLTAAIFALSASAASAKQAWVWACHGPDGAPIATTMETTGDAAVDCAGAGDSGATLRLDGPSSTPAGVAIALPSGVTASSVVVTHRVHGSAAGAHYTVSLDGAGTILDQSLDAPVENLGQPNVAKPGSRTLAFRLTCDQGATCAGPVSVDIVKVRILVDDTRLPYGSVGRNNPVNQHTQMTASVIEEGVGFSRVVASIATAPSDGAVVRTKTVAIGSCDDLTPGDATVDLPLDANRCKRGSQVASFVLGPDNAEGSALNTTDLLEGTYYRRVTVYDAAGNAGELLRTAASDWETFEVWHPVLGSSTQTLSVGSGSGSGVRAQTNRSPTRGAQANQAASCRSPRLSVLLAQKPLRVSRSVVLLQYGKRYRFQGRLTCVVNGRRISAPKRTKLQLLNRVGKRTVTKTGPRIATRGRFKLSLKYPKGSRTLIFRFTDTSKQRAQVSIKIKVEMQKQTSKSRS